MIERLYDLVKAKNAIGQPDSFLEELYIEMARLKAIKELCKDVFAKMPCASYKGGCTTVAVPLEDKVFQKLEKTQKLIDLLNIE